MNSTLFHYFGIESQILILKLVSFPNSPKVLHYSYIIIRKMNNGAHKYDMNVKC